MPIIGNLTTESLFIALSGIAIVFMMLAVLAVIILAISKVVGALTGTQAKPQEAQPQARMQPVSQAVGVAGAQTAPQGGVITLTGVDDKTAACIMAIVSHETGIAPQALIFRSIRAI